MSTYASILAQLSYFPYKLIYPGIYNIRLKIPSRLKLRKCILIFLNLLASPTPFLSFEKEE